MPTVSGAGPPWQHPCTRHRSRPIAWIHGMATAHAASNGMIDAPREGAVTAPSSPPATPPYQPNGRNSLEDPSKICAQIPAPRIAHSETQTTAGKYASPAEVATIAKPTPAAAAA